MNDINNQSGYWNRVAGIKNFTHPLIQKLVDKYLHPENVILDYGCGYGRITGALAEAGFKNVTGVDSSLAMIERGQKENSSLNLIHIDPCHLPFPENYFDVIILFAVLTCIPANTAQESLIKTLCSKLKKGGLIYVSDYYLQQEKLEVSSYDAFENDPSNFGIFTLAEGATFRHHTREWIQSLFQHFKLLEETSMEVSTMNGHAATAFQLVAKK